MDIHNWANLSENLKKNDTSLLLGNGFSIGLCEKFSYTSLLSSFNNQKIGNYLCTKKLFDRLETSNFEEVLRAVFHAYIVSIDNKDALKVLYNDIKNSLIKKINEIHPEYDTLPIKELHPKFINYESIFTTNYDLILYWSILENKNKFCDFFWENYMFNSENTKIWREKIPVFFLHGALHLQYKDCGEFQKTNKLQVSLDTSFDEINFDVDERTFPLFITEGKSSLKLKKIMANDYLKFCYESLCTNKSSNLVIYGHSLNMEYDFHILEAIRYNKNICDIYISVFSGLQQEDKYKFCKKIEADLCSGNRVKIHFFESSTHDFANK